MRIGLITVIKQRYKKVFIISLVLLVIAGGLEVIGIGLLLPLMDYIQNSGQVSSNKITQLYIKMLKWFDVEPNLQSILISILLIICFKTLFIIYQKKYSHKVLLKYQLDYKKQLFANYFRSNWLNILKEKNSIFINAITKEINQSISAIITLNTIFAALINSFIYLVISLYFSWQVIIITAIMTVILFYPFRYIIKEQKKIFQKVLSLNNVIQSYIQESILGAKYIKSTNKIDYFENGFIEKNVIKVKKEHFAYFLKLLVENSNEPVSIFIALIMIYVAVTFFNMKFEEILVLALMINRLYGKIITVTSNINLLQEYIPSFELCNEIINNSLLNVEYSGTRKFKGLSKNIVFKDVFFSYNPKARVFINLNLKIRKGETVAFIGKSGCGKSTALDMITGLLRPDMGNIFIDELPIDEIDLASYRDKIGFVPQEPFLINESILNNIYFNEINHSIESVKEAANIAYADEFIEKLPDKYNTNVGDRGIKLSGGQKQRIALARAILKKPDILILDEATSALDNKSEKLIKSALDNLKGRMTIIIVAHRVTTIENADTIYHFKDGMASKVTYDDCLKL